MEKGKLMPQRNVSIQIVRIVACLLVFVLHFGQIAGAGHLQGVGFEGIVKNFVYFGAYGVHVFLIISGYLCTKTFYKRDSVNIGQYYIKRAISILTLYYLVIAFYFITDNILHYVVENVLNMNLNNKIIPHDDVGLGWSGYLFLLNTFVPYPPRNDFWQNVGFTWSICVFVYFYLIAPFLLKLVKGTYSALILWLSILIGCEIILPHYSCLMLRHINYFFLGVFIFVAIKEKRETFAGVILSFLAILSVLYKDSLFITTACKQFENPYAFACVFGIILLFLLGEGKEFYVPPRIQSVIDGLDAYSYTFYLGHGLVFHTVLERIRLAQFPLWITLSIAIILTPVVTFILGRYIEKPIQKYLTKKFVK